MEHLSEVEDDGARSGVSAFQIQMELVVISLLSNNLALALVQIEEARSVSLEFARGRDLEGPLIGPAAKARRVTIAMLERSFERIRAAIEAPDDDLPFESAN